MSISIKLNTTGSIVPNAIQGPASVLKYSDGSIYCLQSYSSVPFTKNGTGADEYLQIDIFDYGFAPFLFQLNSTAVKEIIFGDRLKINTLAIYGCQFSTLDVSNLHYVTSLGCQGNSFLTSLTISPLAIYTTIAAFSCNLTEIPFPSNLESLTSYNVAINTPNTLTDLDFSTKTSMVSFSSFAVNNCNLTSLTLKAGDSFTSSFAAGGNTGLTTIGNLHSCIFSTAGAFLVQGCSLDITFQFGLVIKKTNILVQDNEMSSANVDASLDYMFNYRLNFNNSIAKTLNISGTNGVATGTYAMGDLGTYGGNVNDLTETEINNLAAGLDYDGLGSNTAWSVKEKIWALVNITISSVNATARYRWTITYN